MKKLIITPILFICVHQVNAQMEINPTISIAETVSLGGFYNTTLTGDYNPTSLSSKYSSTDRSFSTTSIAMGVRLRTKIVDWKIAVENQLLKMRGKEKITFASYLLGLNFECRFLNDKIIRPLLTLSITSELATNYKGNYLQNLDYTPIYYDVSTHTTANLYLGTPFVIHSFLGFNLNASKKISLNFLIGYGCRVLKSRKAFLIIDPNFSTSKPIKSEITGEIFSAPFHMIDLQFGLSYTFSFKKKQKTETP